MKRLLTLLLAVALLALPVASLAEEEKVLNIFTWDTYIDQDTILTPFTEATGIKVNYAPFSSNEEMLTKLEASGGGEYDIILASDYALNIARKAGLLQKLDKDALTNLGNIYPAFMNQYFDPDSEYVVPYVAGTPLIVYDPSRVTVSIEGYDDLWNPELVDSVVVMDDARQVIGITLMTLGYDFNSTDPAELEEAKAKLFELKPNIHVFDYDSPQVQMTSGETTVGYMFTPFVVMTTTDRPDFEVVFPKEGLGFGIDGMVIPVNAPHPENANAFLNFVLQPEIAATVPEVQWYSNVNEAAEPLLSDAVRENPALNIPPEKLEGSHYTEDLGETEALYQEIWTEMKQQ